MKKLLLSLGLAIPFIAHSQTPFSAHDSININNVNARANVHGDLWEDFVEGTAACRFPNGSMKNVGFASFLIISGLENGNIMHLSAADFISTGTMNPTEIDYWPGPLDNSGNTDTGTISKWAKVWKVNGTDISDFLSQTTHTLGNTPESVLRWPAKGNTYALDANNNPLSIAEDMAPFWDVNGNGVYDALGGDYPNIKGQQMLWWVINDNGAAHTNTTTPPLKVQVEISAYAYSRNTLIDNVVYYEYKIKNKSGINYMNVRFGQTVDFDLGLYADDYVGFDSSFRMGYVYNADDTDGTIGDPGVYGTDIPVAGLTFVHTPGDNGNNREPLGGFRLLGGSPPIDPTAGYYDSAMRDLTPFVDECLNNNPPGDRKFIMGTGDFDLNANSFETVVMALVIADEDDDNHCPDLDSVTIATVADTAWGNFNFPLTIKPSNKNVTSIKIYPNPASDIITIEGTTEEQIVSVFDVMGRELSLNTSNNGHKRAIDIKQLPAGPYMITIDGLHAQRFIKR